MNLTRRRFIAGAAAALASTQLMLTTRKPDQLVMDIPPHGLVRIKEPREFEIHYQLMHTFEEAPNAHLAGTCQMWTSTPLPEENQTMVLDGWTARWVRVDIQETS